MKNTSEFNKRYQRWKAGEQVYSAGKIVQQYDDGKDQYGTTLPEVTVIANPKPYNNFLKTLPSNLKNTDESEYRMHRYWELRGMPKNFDEAKKRKMFSLESDYDKNGKYLGKSWHAPSVSENPETGDVEFMKYPDHPTINEELKWFNSPKAASFRRNHRLDTDSEPYYIYRKIYGKGNKKLNKPE